MREKLHSLKKARIRQSWNKYNLYNLMRQRPLRIEGRSLFQQKYAAKQEARRYHGEHISKRQWQNMFRHSLHSVVPMNARVLAGEDGSIHAAGRGAGLEVVSGLGAGMGGGELSAGGRRSVVKVPYMNQMWAPMERRLDMAVFRAMFASSARQARQFVVHGFVRVNGKKMKHPGYMLNPGDMFSVDPEQVLFATGAPKHKPRPTPSPKSTSDDGESSESSESSPAEPTSESPSEPTSPQPTASEPPSPQPTASEPSPPPPSPEDVEASESSTEPGDTDPQTPRGNRQPHQPPPLPPDPLNPLDPSKPYATPWRPRDYMSPFAFIPRYLEVNFNICHAVYLRHPVARPGSSEVPSPFGPETQQLAFHWFLRRR